MLLLGFIMTGKPVTHTRSTNPAYKKEGNSEKLSFYSDFKLQDGQSRVAKVHVTVLRYLPDRVQGVDP
jgi:hypothetical protein